MKVLLDECVPKPVLEPLRLVLGAAHQVDHVEGIGWKSKKDKFLLPEARTKGYSLFVTRGSRQLRDPDETKAIKRSRMHWVSYKQKDGLAGLGLAMGAVLAALPSVVAALDGEKQTLVEIKGLRPTGRWERVEVRGLPYWRR